MSPFKRNIYVVVALSAALCAGAPIADEPRRVLWVYGSDIGLTLEDAKDIAEHVDNVIVAAVTYKANLVVRHGRKERLATVIAAEQMVATAELSGLAVWPVESGSFIDEDDIAGARVAVIGGPIRDALFGANVAAIGQELTVGGRGFRVKGVLAPHPPFVGVTFPDPEKTALALSNRIYVPFRAATDLFPEDKNLAHIRVSVEDLARIDETAASIGRRLEDRHGGRALLEILPMPDHGRIAGEPRPDQ